ncbi:uncharacterized protein LOC131216644 [Anopheles bellator]|uniref:uncharacterized protein LOC131216644 n=1 Tax=Anopheles bellator TaxID=139047 RepID=UPI0026472C0B|nr:uncharacterized protein LOC131216644 [Anopheles bellator]
MSDLPDELWCTIFDYLDLVTLKDASLVCRRWADLTFSGKRMNRVALDGCFFPESNRNYRHVRLAYSLKTRFDDWCQVVRKYSPSIVTLEIEMCSFITSLELQTLLAHLPSLYHLTIRNGFKECTESIIPYELLPTLKYLSFDKNQDSSAAVRLCMAAPNLECLHMNCTAARELDVYRHFSGQLKLVYVAFLTPNFYNPFMELNFPCLEELSIYEMLDEPEYDLETSQEFFRRHTSLRRLSIKSHFIPNSLIQIITGYCDQLTHLSLNFRIPTRDGGTFGSLSQLTGLKYLKLEGYLESDIFQGCNAMHSLETIEVGEFHLFFPVELLHKLYTVAPRLTCLKYEPNWLPDTTDNDLVLRYIFSSFPKLTRLTLSEYPGMWRELDYLKFERYYIDKLRKLREFEVRCWSTKTCKIYKYFPRNNVRYLEIIGHDPLFYKHKVLPLHHNKLQRLILVPCDRNDSESSFEWVHRLLPKTRIYVRRSVWLENLHQACYGGLV